MAYSAINLVLLQVITAVILIWINDVEGGAYIRVKFLSFDSRGREWGYSKCDSIWSSCDPWFTSVQLVTSLGTKFSMTGADDHENKNYVSFGSTISDNIPNPFTSSLLSSYSGGFSLKVTIYDKDSGFLGGSDKLDVINKYLSGTRKTSTYYWNSATVYGTRPGGTSRQSILKIQWQVYCQTNYYGTKCTVYCKATSKYTCNTSTGAKQCKTNYYGSTCSKFCASTTKYRCDSSGNKICNSYYYGSSCETYCRAYSSSTFTCDKKTGAKICKPYYYGTSCGTYCRAYSSSKYTCDVKTGAKICKLYYYGTSCGTYCRAYSSSTYTCDSKTGAKVCKTNYYVPPSCSVQCVPTTKYKCSSSGTKVCTTNYYGTNCDTYCIAYYWNTYTCDSKTGAKICKTNYYGASCAINCKETDQYTCGSNGSRICKKNYFGSKCSVHCAPTTQYKCSSTGRKICEDYYYGTSCAVYCKATSSSTYTCDQNTGAKICKPGWTSKDCDVSLNECASNPCLNGGTCVDGTNSYTCKCEKHFLSSTDCKTWTGPNKPTNLHVATQTATTATISWTPPIQVSDAIDGYYYSLEDGVTHKKKVQSLSASRTSNKFLNLVPIRQYEFKLYAYYLSKTGKKLLNMATTLKFIQLPNPVTSLHSVLKKTTELSVRWIAPTNHTIKGTKVVVYKKGSSMPVYNKDITYPTARISGLEAGEEYSVSVKTYIFNPLNGNARLYSEDTKLTVILQPKPPQKPSVDKVSNSSASLSWEAPDQKAPVAGYIVNYSIGSLKIKQEDIKGIKTVIDVLAPTFTYQLTITAYVIDENNKKLYSDAVSLSFITAPNPPTQLRISGLSSSFRIKWLAPVQIIAPMGYSVKVTKDKSTSPVKTIKVTDIYASVSDLLPGRKYMVEVATYILDKQQRELYSVGVHLTVVLVPLPPISVHIVSTTSSSMVLRWKPDPKSQQDGYMVRPHIPGPIPLPGSIQNSGSTSTTGSIPYPGSLILPIKANSSSVVVPNLKPGQNYSFTVQAYSFGVSSMNSKTVSNTTDPSPVASFVVTQDPNTLTKVMLTWTPSSGGIDSYVIKYGSGQVFVVENSTRSKTITGLDLQVKYSFVIYSVYNEKLSKPVFKDVKMPEYPVVKDFKVLSTTNTSVTVSWRRISVMSSFVNNLTVVDIETGNIVFKDFAYARVTTKTFNNLKPGRGYVFTLAISQLGATAKGVEAIAKTHTNPSTPRSLALSAVTSSEITLTWNPDKDSFQDKYIVTVYNGAQNHTINSTKPEVTISHLIPGKMYGFTVQASSGGKLSGNTPKQRDSTLPMPVLDLTITTEAKNVDAVVMKWSPGPGHFKSFAIKYGTRILKDVTGTSVKLENLTLGSNYTFSVKALSKYGKYSLAVTKTLTVADIPVVDSIMIVSTTTTTMMLRWSPIMTLSDFTHKLRAIDIKTGTISQTWTIPESVSSKTLKGLLPGRPYQLMIVVIKANRVGTPKNVTDNTNPLSPTNLQLSGITTTSMSLKWIPETGSTQNSYLITATPSNNQGAATTLKSLTTSANVTNLTPGQGYSFVVVAVSNGRASANSNVKKDSTYPSPVADLKITRGVNEDMVTLSWKPAPGEVDSYSIIYDGNTVSNIPSSETSKKITGLFMPYTYNFEIVAVRYGKKSEPVSEKHRTRQIEKLQNFEVVSATTTSLMVKWEGIASLADYTCTITYTNMDSSNAVTQSIKTIPVSQTTQNITGLQSGYSYNITIMVKKGSSSGKINSLINNTVPLAPTNLQLSATKSTTTSSISVTWSKRTYSIQDGYIVTVTPTNNNAAKTTVKSLTTSATITNLTPGKKYKLMVKAVTNGRSSENSLLLVENTYPSKVGSFDVNTGPFDDTVTFKWSFGSGEVQSYSITYDEKTVSPIPSSNYNKTITGLAMSKKYTFAIVAVSYGKKSEMYQKEFTTPALRKVKDFKVVTVTTTSITVSWEKFKSLTGFKSTITFTDTSSGSSTNSITGITESHTSQTITGLQAGHSYNLTISVEKGGSKGVINSLVNNTIPLAPKNLKVSTSSLPTTSQITLLWQADAASKQDGYMILVNATDGSSSPFRVASASSPGSVTNLVPGKKYQFVVIAVSNGRLSEKSNAVSENTLPTAVKQLTITMNNNLDSVRVDWESGSGDKDKFILTYGSKSIDNINGTKSSLVVHNLSMNHEYTFGIKASSYGKSGEKVTEIYKTQEFPVITGLSTTSVKTTSLKLLWTAVTVMKDITYVVNYTEGSGSSQHSITGIESSVTSKEITGLKPGVTYTFKIAVAKGGSNGGTASTQETTYPLPPINFRPSATTSQSTREINLTWDPNPSSVQNTYSISVSDTSGNAVTSIQTSITGTKGTVTNLVPGTMYQFVVFAISGARKSDESAKLPVPTAPTSVATFTVTQGNVLDSVKVKWTPGEGMRSTYTLTYGNKTKSSIPGTTTSITINNLTLSRNYTFGLTAHSNDKTSVKKTLEYKGPNLPVVQDLKATAFGEGTITISWSDNTFNLLDNYSVNVTYTEDKTGAITKTRTGITNTGLTLTGLVPGQTYSIGVAAFKFKVTGSATTITANSNPRPPLNLVLSASSPPTTSQVTFSWQEASNSVQTGYNVSVNPAEGSIAISGTTATVTGLTAGKQYTLSVKAVSNSQFSTASNGLVFNTAPSAPASLSVALGSEIDNIVLSWTHGPGVRDTYIVMFGNKTIKDIPHSQTSVPISELTLSKTYTFSVKAISYGTHGVTINKVFTMPDLPTVQNLQVTSATISSITISWTDVNTISGHSVNVTYTANNAGAITKNVTGITAASHNITGLIPGQSYTLSAAFFKNGVIGSSISIQNNTYPLAPTEVTVVTSTTSTVSLSWSPSATSVQDAYLINTTNSDGTVVTSAQWSVSDTTGIVTNLTPGKQYWFSIIAVSNERKSINSDKHTGITTPTSAVTFTVTQGNVLDSVKVQWTHGEGIRSTYTLTYGSKTNSSIPGTTTSITINNLTLSRNYTVGLTAHSKGKTSVKKTVDYKVPNLPVVQDLKATAFGEGTITISWSDNTFNLLDNYSFNVTYTKDKTGAITKARTGITNTGLTLTGLVPGQTYSIGVAAFKFKVTGSSTTITANSNPRPPLNLVLSASSPPTTSQVTFSWQEASNSVQTGYNVSVNPAEGSIAISGTTATVTGLTAGKQYTLSVKAVSNSQFSTASNGLVFNTAPSAPASLSVALGSEIDNIVLSWTHGPGVRDTYIVMFGNKTIKDIPHSQTSVPISELTLSKTYTFSVKAISYGTHGVTINKVFTMPDLPTVQNLQVTSATISSITISWTDVNTISGHSVNVTYTANNAGAITKNVTGITAASHNITGLIPGQSYTLSAAFFKNGVIGSSISIQNNTYPLAPTEVTVVTSTTSTVSLSWSPSATSVQDAYLINTTNSDGTVVTSAQWSVSDTTGIVTNLTPGKQYWFSIIAVSNERKSINSDKHTGITTPTSAATLTVTQGNVLDSVKVQWTPGEGMRSTYTLTYGNKTKSSIPGTTTSITINNLTLSRNYTFGLTAHINLKKSVKKTAEYKVPNLPVVQDLKATAFGEGTITLSWSNNTFNLLDNYSFNVTYTENKAGTVTKTRTGITNTGLTLTGLVPGQTYSIGVAAFKFKVTGSATTITANSKPLSPTGLSIVNSKTNTVNLKWSSATTSIEDSYQVNVFNNDGTAFSSAQATVTGTSAVVSNLTPGTTYLFGVVAISNGRKSGSSVKVNGSTVPATAASLTVTGGNLRDSVKVEWTHGEGDRTLYSIKYGTLTKNNIPGTSTSATIENLNMSQTYTFGLRAHWDGLVSTRKVVDYVVPGFPTVLNFHVASVTNTTISLAWTALTSVVNHAYIVMHTEVANGASTKPSQPVTGTSYVVTGLKPGQNYTLAVAVFKSGAMGPASTKINNTKPLSPTGLSIVSSTTNTVNLKWSSAATSVEDSYQVRVFNIDGTVFPSAQATVTGTSAVVSNLTPGTTYSFSTLAVSNGRKSGNSVKINGSTVPATSASFTVTGGNLRDSVKVEWTHGEGSRTLYSIQYGTLTKNNIPGTSTSATIENLNMSQTYTFGLRAHWDGLVSARKVVDYAVPGFPTVLNVHVSSATNTTISLAWTAVTSVVNHSYIVMHTEEVNGASTKPSQPVTGTSYVVTGLKPGQNYTFAVAVSKGGVVGPASTKINNTKPSSPTDLTSVATTKTQITLAWQAASGSFQDGYNLTMFPQSTAAQIAISGITAVVSNLIPGMKYRFNVTARSGNRFSNVENGVSVHTNPSKPASISVTEGALRDSVTISWTHGDGEIQSYTIIHDSITIPNVQHTLTSYTANNLKFGHSYTFSVVAVSYGTSSDPVSAQFTVADLPPVTGLNVTEASQSSLSLSWTQVPKLFATYNLTYSEDISGSTATSITGVTATSYVINGLSPGHFYRISLLVFKSNFSGPATTITNNTIPVSPINLTSSTTSPATTSQISIKWAPGTGSKQDGYNVTVATTDNSALPSTVQSAITGTSAIVTGLVAGTRYKFVVTAKSGNRMSGNSNELLANTAPSPVVSITVKQGSKNDSANVTWTVGNGNIASFTVTYGTETVPNIGATTNSVTVNDLSFDMTYTFGVIVVSNGMQSVKVSKDYTTSVFPTITGLESTTQTSTSIAVTWNALQFVTGYTQTVKIQDETAGSAASSTSGIDRSVTTKSFVGLQPGHKYKITIVASKGDASSTEIITTESTPPLPAQSLTIVKGSLDNSVDVTWAPPDTGRIDSFTITYGTEEIKGISKTSTSTTINNLFMGEDYTFAIVTVSYGENSTSLTQTYTTPAYPVAQDFRVTVSEATRMKAVWQKVTTLPEFTYTLNVTSYGTLIMSQANINKNTVFYWINDLTTGTMYNVSLSVVNGQVAGKPAHTSNNTKPDNPAWENINVTGVDTTHIKVNYTSTQDSHIQYVVKYHLSSEANNDNLQEASCIKLPCVIDASAMGPPGTELRVHLIAKLGVWSSNAGKRVGRTKPVAPQFVNEVKSLKNQRSLTFTWPFVSDSASVFTHYYLCIYDGVTGQPVKTKNVQKDTIQTAFGGLIQGKLYNVTLALRSGIEYSSPVYVIARTIPYKVAYVVEAKANTTNITYSWTAPTSGVYTKFRILLEEVTGSEVATTKLNHTFTNLTPGVYYTPVIVTQSGEDNSGFVTYSSQGYIEPGKQSFTAPMPVSPKESDIESNSARLNWLPPTQGELVGYEITLYKNADCTDVKQFTKRLKYWTNFKFNGLQPATTYCGLIRSYTGPNNNRKYSIDVRYHVTTVPTSPQQVATSSVTTNSLTVTWQAPTKGSISGYTVTVLRSDEYYPDQTHNVTGATSLSLTGLAEGQLYRISVHAFITDTNGNNIYGTEGFTTVTTGGNAVTVTGTTTSSTALLLPYDTHSKVFDSASSCDNLQSTTFCAREYSLPGTVHVRFLSADSSSIRMAITTAGYVSFRGRYYILRNDKFMKRVPGKWNEIFTPYRRLMDMYTGQVLLAPFYSDTKFVLGSKSAVYYVKYHDDETGNVPQNAITYCNSAVTNYTNYAGFSTKMVVIVTWENMVPATGSSGDKTNTFQLVLISGQLSDDTSHTFAMYLYGKMDWDVAQPIHVGYYMSTSYNTDTRNHTETAFSSLESPYSLTPNNIDTVVNSKTGKAGVYFYQLSSYVSNPSASDLCVNWYNREKELTPVPYYNWHFKYTTPQYLEFFNQSYGAKISCPCDVNQAEAENKWRLDIHQQYHIQSDKKCYNYITPFWHTTKTCCYNKNTGALITAEDGSGGYMYLFHPLYGLTKNYHYLHDHYTKSLSDKPSYYQLCCVDSNNCDKFYEMRPNDDCSLYKPPQYSWFQGDPHITTLDNHKYTFNGIGEYMLIKTSNAMFTLQGRTEKLIDINGQTKEASVFTAIAGQDNGGDMVQVQLKEDRSGIEVYAAYTDITQSWFNTMAIGTDMYDYEKVTISKLSNTSVSLIFESGFVVSIASASRQLSLTVTAPATAKSKTMGLLGVYNNYASDDYTKRDGTTLNINSTEAQVFQDFGQQWRVTVQESLFSYPAGKNYTDYADTSFQPQYFSNLKQQISQADWNSMSIECQGNTYCLYDYALTGDKELALISLQADQAHSQTSSMFANNRPVITVNKYFNVTLNQSSNFTVTTSDVDGDSVSISVTFVKQTNGSDISSQLSRSGNVYSWTPATNDAVTITLNAVDSRGGVAAEVQLQIRICECFPNKGICAFDILRSGQSTTAPFVHVESMCNTGWTGSTCDEDINGCGDNPCGANTVCTDVPATSDTTGGAYVCGACTTGFEKRSGQNSDCININECTSGTHNCDSTNGICTDTVGSFTCGCKVGFRQASSGITCTDIDECAEGTSGCAHTCTNNVGSFQCSCETGYLLDTDQKTCLQNPAISAQCASAGCDYCKGTSSLVQCFCPNGYQLQSDGKTCLDIDECQSTSTHTCDLSLSSCRNIAGSYECICNTGYQLRDDQRTCEACNSGYWGTNCANICKCKAGTTCSTTQGCSQCADSGFTGGNCDVDVNECSNSNLCGSGTSGCVNTPGSFKCTCQSGYEAISNTQCQDINDCNSQPCLNGAQCNNMVGPGYTCDCIAGYSGSDCEIDIDECVSSPCQHGGTCDNKVNQFRCVCPDNYKGKLCEVHVPPSVNDDIKNNIVPDDAIDGNLDDQSQSQSGSDAATGESGGMAVGVIAGAAVGIVALAAVGIVLLVYFVKKKAAAKAASNGEKKHPLPEYDEDPVVEYSCNDSKGPGKNISSKDMDEKVVMDNVEDGPILSVAPVFYQDAFYNHENSSTLQMKPQFPALPKQPGKVYKGFNPWAAMKHFQQKFPSKPLQPTRGPQAVGHGSGINSGTAIPTVQE